MKKAVVCLLLTVLVLLLVPFLASQGRTALPRAEQSGGNSVSRASAVDEGAVIPVLTQGEVKNITLRDYLCGSVAAEMPASYGIEALKAQAVAACSYMVYRLESLRSDPDLIPEHRGACVCDDPSHCKGYMSADEMRAAWGEEYFGLNYPKIEAAVDAVMGEIITSDGKPCNAVFHAVSAGMTENAADVWGVDVPYLRAAESYVDRSSENYEHTVSLERDKLYSLLSIIAPDGLDESLEIGEITRTPSGGVVSCTLGGAAFTGAQLRSALSLPSANFTLTRESDAFTFVTHGSGHCVGMSQYGAGQLAAAGMDYKEILKTYYAGVEIESYDFSDIR